jgi:DNA-binding GntR family transcriptional regulator
MSSVEADDVEPLHTAVTKVIRENIATGYICPGMILRESALVEQFAISRVPVARALKELESEGLIEREQGKGFRVVGLAVQKSQPAPVIKIPNSVVQLARGVPSWERIYDQVERDLVAAMPFGRHKIVESGMAEYYAVSRTVTGDLLARLQERGLVERPGRSQTHLPPLTESMITDLYAVRELLEPAALLVAAPHLPRTELEHMYGSLTEAECKYPQIKLEQLDVFEQELHVKLMERAPNKRLLAALRVSQLPLLATNHLLKRYLGAPEREPLIAEHRIVIELLLNGAPDAAAAALKAHLSSACSKGVERIRLVRSYHSPSALPFLVKI